jgi:hypothetical protein
VGDWPTYNATTAPTDTDIDGMPDAWETANGLNPNSSADGNTFTLSLEGYTNLEVYLNSLVGTITEKQNLDGVVTSLAEPKLEETAPLNVFYNAGVWSIHSRQPVDKIEVFNLFGQRLLSFKSNDASDWSESAYCLAPGLYMVRAFMNNNKVNTIKVRVNN